MRGQTKILQIAAAAMLVLPAVAHADTTTAQYVGQVDPICQPAARKFARLLVKMDSVGAIPIHEVLSQKQIRRRNRRLGRRFAYVGGSFERMISQISAVPPPTADAALFGSWLKSLRADRRHITAMGRLLKANQEGRFLKRTGLFLIHVDETTRIVDGVGFNYCAFSTTAIPWWGSGPH